MRPVSPQFLVVKTIALFVMWVMLSAKFDLFHLGLGGVLSFLVAWINAGHSPFVPRFHVWGRIVLYLPWLFARIVQSSLHVSKLILHPKLPINPKLIQYRPQIRYQPAVVLLGNSITLTPGTITAEINDQELLVHAMDDVSAEDVVNRKLETKIASVFGEKEPVP